MALRTIAMRNSGEKLPVSMHCHNLHCFEEGVILLCRRILETRQISHSFNSVVYNPFNKIENEK